MNRGSILGLIVIACLFAQAAVAHAHGGGSLRGLDGAESSNQHEREHAALDRAVREAREEWDAMTPAQQRDQLAREAAEQRDLELAAGPPAQDGSWTTAPFPISTFAIHMVMLPTGKVLFWGYPPLQPNRPNEGRAGIWDPSAGTGPSSVREITTPPLDVNGDGTAEPVPFYCSGQSMLPTGEVLITGGNLAWAGERGYTGFAGLKEVFTFDPFNESFTQQPSMRRGRWYPTQTELADGRTVVLGGLDENPPEGQMNNEVEIFTPSEQRGGVGEMDYYPGATRTSDLYPIGFSLRDGNFLTGAPASPGVLNTETHTWESVPPNLAFRRGASAVLLPSDPSGPKDAMVMGGSQSQEDANGVEAARTSSEILDTANLGSGWKAGPSFNLSRSNANVVQLPDGSMVAVGGGAGFSPQRGYYYTADSTERRQVELFDPQTNTWRLGPPQEENRTYHSTAVLLPDGRVLSAGDDFHPSVGGSFSQSDTAEIYSPPYLFKGSRPSITSAPAEIAYGEEFSVGTSGAASRAVLMAPGATTHAFDMQQRNVSLQLNGASGGTLKLESPADGGVAPPGYYMLFVLDAAGVPSVASWVHLDGEREPPKPPQVAGDGPSVGVKLVRPLGAGSKVRALVTSDRPATVDLGIQLKGAGHKAGGRKARLSFSQAGTKLVLLKAKRRGTLRAAVWVDAWDSEGRESAWKRTYRVGAKR